METVQFHNNYENRNHGFDTLPQNTSSFIRRLSFDGSFSPSYGLNNKCDEFEIENTMGRNNFYQENQNPNLCFRKLTFGPGEENEDIFFSEPDSGNFQNNYGGGPHSFASFGDQTDLLEFKMHCGPQETPTRMKNKRDLSNIKRSATCHFDDMLLNASRSNSQDIFQFEQNVSGQENSMCIEVESNQESTPIKCLPTSKNMKNPGLSAITPQTLIDLVNNTQNQPFLIIDCRYDYEYQGGHIKGAVHVDCPAMLETLFITYKHLLFNRESLEIVKQNFSYLQSHPQYFNSIQINPEEYTVPIIVFHCEFSQKRGPRALRMLREIDRQHNYYDCSSLYYPEVYILEGGYCNFHKQFPDYCSPEHSYIKMVDDKYRTMFKEAREKEKEVWEESKPSLGKMISLQRSKTAVFL